MTITRGKFEQLTDGLLNRTRQPCKDCLKDAGISQSEVTEVLLVGGMTRMPKVGSVQQMQRRSSGKGVHELQRSLHHCIHMQMWCTCTARYTAHSCALHVP